MRRNTLEHGDSRPARMVQRAERAAMAELSLIRVVQIPEKEAMGASSQCQRAQHRVKAGMVES